MSTEEEETQPQPRKQEVIAIHRLGNIQVLLTMEGTGMLARPMARVLKSVSKEVLDANPQANQVFEMEELLALRHVCDEAIRHASHVQLALPQEGEGA